MVGPRGMSPRSILKLDQQVIHEQDEEHESDDMAFEDAETFTKQTTKPSASRSFKQSRSDLLNLAGGFNGILGNEDVYKKVNEILFFLYVILQEQLFKRPYLFTSSTTQGRVSSRSFKTKRTASQQNMDPYEDQIKNSGRIFGETIDPMLKKEIEAQFAYMT